MKPVYFKESNKDLLKPSNMSTEECGSLPIFTDGNQCVSRWRLSIIERIKVMIYGHVWLVVLSGQTQHPVWLDTKKTVFTKPPFLSVLFFNLHPSFLHFFGLQFKFFNLFHKVLLEYGRNWGIGLLQIKGRHLFYIGVTASEFRFYFLFIRICPFAHRFTKERAKKMWFWKGQLVCRFIGHSIKNKHWCNRCKLTREEWGK